MNFSEHKHITHANRMPPLSCHPHPHVSALVCMNSKTEESMFYTGTIYSYALSNCTNSYILSLIYVLWLLLIACFYTIPFLSLSVCGLFFNSNTFSMVSGCIHRSLLQCVGHILQPKVSLRCNPSFRFGHFQMTTLVFYIVHFHTLKGEHDVVSV